MTDSADDSLAWLDELVSDDSSVDNSSLNCELKRLSLQAARDIEEEEAEEEEEEEDKDSPRTHLKKWKLEEWRNEFWEEERTAEKRGLDRRVQEVRQELKERVAAAEALRKEEKQRRKQRKQEKALPDVSRFNRLLEGTRDSDRRGLLAEGERMDEEGDEEGDAEGDEEAATGENTLSGGVWAPEELDSAAESNSSGVQTPPDSVSVGHARSCRCQPLRFLGVPRSRISRTPGCQPLRPSRSAGPSRLKPSFGHRRCSSRVSQRAGHTVPSRSFPDSGERPSPGTHSDVWPSHLRCRI